MCNDNGELMFLDDLLEVDHPTPEEEKQFWNGIGSLTIFVTLVIPKSEVFEYEIIDYGGCVQGAQDTLGIDYLLSDIWDVWHDLTYPLKEGFEYTFHDITIAWTRGDGWTTDDDVDYYMGPISYRFSFFPWLKTKVQTLWWKNIGWRLK